MMLKEYFKILTGLVVVLVISLMLITGLSDLWPGGVSGIVVRKALAVLKVVERLPLQIGHRKLVLDVGVQVLLVGPGEALPRVGQLAGRGSG